MRWVNSGGVMLHTQCLGDGPPIVMCHGLVTASLATWYFSAAPALRRRHRVVLYDLRGHGKSSLAATGYDLETMARDLAFVVDAHRQAGAATSGQKVALVGHSYGALIALTYALRRPEAVSRLVLIDAPLPAAQYVYPSMARIESVSALRELFPAHDDGQAMRELRRRRRTARERIEFLILRSSLRQDLRAAHDIPDADLESLHIPTLCLYGRHSDCAAAGRRLARLLPSAELRWIDSDHFIPIRAPAEMTEHLVSYLSRETRSS